MRGVFAARLCAARDRPRASAVARALALQARDRPRAAAVARALFLPALLLLCATAAADGGAGCSSLDGPACLALNARAPPAYARALVRSPQPPAAFAGAVASALAAALATAPMASAAAAAVAAAAAAAAAAGRGASAAANAPGLQRTFRFDLGDGLVVDVALEAQSALVERGPLIEGLMDALARAVASRNGGAAVRGELLARMRSAVELLVDGAILPEALAEAQRRAAAAAEGGRGEEGVDGERMP